MSVSEAFRTGAFHTFPAVILVYRGGAHVRTVVYHATTVVPFGRVSLRDYRRLICFKSQRRN